jgi:SulP family sulfate permease
LLLSLKKLHPKIPAAIITLLTSSLIVRIFNWEQNGVFLIRHIGDISNSNLRFRIPSIYLDSDIAQTLLSGAGAVAILSLLETVTVAKAIAQKNNQRIKPSREFISQGLASIIGGFFQCIPTSGSLSRSAVNYQEGANTRVSTALSGLIVFIALIVFKRWLGYIPMVSLASVVIVSAFHLVDAHHLKLTWKGRGISKIVLSITFITVIFLPLQLSIYLGTLLSIGIYLFESSRLKLSSLELSEEGKFVEHELKNVFDESSSIAIINIEGDLYFAAVDDLEKNIIKIFNANKKKIILRFRRTRLMASTGITALEGLVLQAKNNNIDVLLSGVAKDFYETLDDCGIKENIGEENIFLATDIPYQSTHQAFKFSVSPLSENEREMYYDTLRRH